MARSLDRVDLNNPEPRMDTVPIRMRDYIAPAGPHIRPWRGVSIFTMVTLMVQATDAMTHFSRLVIETAEHIDDRSITQRQLQDNIDILRAMKERFTLVDDDAMRLGIIDQVDTSDAVLYPMHQRFVDANNPDVLYSDQTAPVDDNDLELGQMESDDYTDPLGIAAPSSYVSSVRDLAHAMSFAWRALVPWIVRASRDPGPDQHHFIAMKDWCHLYHPYITNAITGTLEADRYMYQLLGSAWLSIA